MKFPNLVWAISTVGAQWEFAVGIKRSESWLSRRLNGRFEFSPEDRKTVAQALGYPEGWLFEEIAPPTRSQSGRLMQAQAYPSTPPSEVVPTQRIQTVTHG